MKRSGVRRGDRKGRIGVANVDSRLVAGLAAVTVIAGISGCSVKPPALGGSTATVTINGTNAGGTQQVRCSQTGWSWFIESLDGEKSGFKASFNTSAQPRADSVQIHNLGGFTGTYWAGTVGQAEANVANGIYTISGTAEGAFTDNPTDDVTATFRIEADC